MDFKKIALYVLLVVSGLALYNAWVRDTTQLTATNVSQQASNNAAAIPQGTRSDAAKASSVASPTLPANIAHQVTVPDDRLIHVRTDVLDVAIDKLGGNIVDTRLLKYAQSTNDKSPLQILNHDANSLYLAQSGIVPAQQTGPLKPVMFQSAKTSYRLQPGDHALVVSLTGKTADGLQITKNYTFQPNHYAVKLNYQLDNKGEKKWTGSFYTQLKRRNTPEKSHFIGMRSYAGAAMYTPDKPYKKLPYTTLAEQNINANVHGGWLAMQQQYFLSAWVPNQATNNTYFSRVDSVGNPNNIFTVGVVMPQLSLASGQSANGSATLYVGPEEASRLSPLAPYLDRTVDYGWLWMLSKPIFLILEFIHHWVGNWGLAIIFVTILIKLAFFKLSEMSYVSMAKMRQLQPRLQALKEKYGDDRQSLGQETMKMYREEKINPLSGCLPMLLQIPFFIALYYVLMESVELRQAPFILWIHDLSVKDPFYILPVLMVLSMILQQRLSPQPADDMQAKMMMVMPILFGVMFASFPAGLVLYWITNNCISIAQQWFIMKRYDKKHKPRSGSFKKA